jgi:uncharacterized protein YycO
VPYTPQPGDIGLSSSTGPIGKFIRAAQALIGDYSFVTHAFIVLPGGELIEAMPKGASFATVDKYPNAIYSRFPLTHDQRMAICEEAIRMHGTPYSFLDYLALGATHFNIYPEPIRRRVVNSGKMICSQLAAEAYRRAGVDLFPDNRLPMDVTPGDLSRLFLEFENNRDEVVDKTPGLC